MSMAKNAELSVVSFLSNFSPKRFTLGRLIYTLLASSILSGHGLSSSTQAQPRNEFSRQITEQLDALASSLRADGYVEVASYMDEIGLATGEARTWDLSLNANAEYVITAVCDNDCQNIDLELIEGNTLVDADREDDAYPMVVGVPGNYLYKAKVIMVTCGIEPCYSGVRVFRQE